MAAKAQLKADRSGSGSGVLTAAAEVVPVVKMNPGADEQGRHGEVRWGEAEIRVDGRGSSAEGQAVLLAH